MITIGKPIIIQKEIKSRLQAEFNIDGKVNTVWFDVEKEYGNYLCYERADAFVIGVLNYAMRNGHDIQCVAPMGEELHYQITTYLVDAVYKGSSNLHKTKIISEIDTSILNTANAVGTGISCGVDSLYAISTHSATQYANHNITHLAFNNVGSHGEGERAVNLYNARKKMAMNFAVEYGYKFVESSSNIYDIIQQNHLLSHTYSSCFAIYCLQKLYSTYYYASGHSFLEFSLANNEKFDASFYDLLTLNMLSTSKLKIHSQGGTYSRLEKIKVVSDFKPSYNFLNVCIDSVENCNKCEKCTRTLLALDAIGKLENYSSVFDVEYYRKNLQKYYAKLVYYKLMNNQYYVELYPLLKSKISKSSKIKGYFIPIELKAKAIILPIIPQNIKSILRKIIKKIGDNFKI